MAAKAIEVELRCRLNPGELRRWRQFFDREGELLAASHEETHYLTGPQDLRIQRSDQGAKVWLKGGQIHDNLRSELEIPVRREDFDKLRQLLATIGLVTEIVWLRHRRSYGWKGVTICLDDTKDYAQILEIEKVVTLAQQTEALKELRDHLRSLGLRATPKAEFDRLYQDYRADWRRRLDWKEETD